MTKKAQPTPSAMPEIAPAQAASIASPQEVLETFTAMLRGENGEKPAEQLKAAEHLAKHYGILSPREEQAPVKAAIAGEIEAAIRSLEGAPPLPDGAMPLAASAQPEVSVDGQDGP